MVCWWESRTGSVRMGTLTEDEMIRPKFFLVRPPAYNMRLVKKVSRIDDGPCVDITNPLACPDGDSMHSAP
jgi:hypothetical protein